MNLNYAVDRLYEVGWLPSSEMELDRLDDGRSYPTVLAVQREFARSGLELAIKHNVTFHCYRASWGPLGEVLNPSHRADDTHGTVVGVSEQEAAVYALAQLLALGLIKQTIGT